MRAGPPCAISSPSPRPADRGRQAIPEAAHRPRAAGLLATDPVRRSAPRKGEGNVGRPTHPKTVVVVPIVRVVVIPGRRPRIVRVVVPRTPAQHAAAIAGFTIFPSITRAVFIGCIDRSRPFPHVAGHVDQSLGSVSLLREDPNWGGSPDSRLVCVAQRRVVSVAVREPPPLLPAGGSLPLDFRREPDWQARLGRQPGAIGPRLVPVDADHRLRLSVEVGVVPECGVVPWFIVVPPSKSGLEFWGVQSAKPSIVPDQ